jgi:hypothetical protein
VVALLGVDGLDFDVDVNEDECALLLLLVCIIIIIIIISDVSRLVNTKEGEKKFSSFFSTLDRFSRTKRTKKSLLINSSLFSFKKEFVIKIESTWTKTTTPSQTTPLLQQQQQQTAFSIIDRL